MSYGVKVLNADGRTLINTDEIAPNTFTANRTASAYTSMVYPPAGFAAGDLVLAKPASSPIYTTPTDGGSVPISASSSYNGSRRFWGSSSHPSYFYQNTAGISTALVKTQAGNIAGPSAGEYGMDILSSDGSTFLFSATRTTSVNILAIGYWLLAIGVLSANQTFTYTPPSALDYSKIYGVCNSSMIHAIPQNSVFPSWSVSMNYIFYPAHTSPYIRVQNFTNMGGTNVNTSALFPYMILYDPN